MRRVFGAEFETPVRHPCRPRDPCISRLSSRATACFLLPVFSNAESVRRQPNVSNVVPDHAEDLDVPETGGWVLIASDPMGVLVDADGIFGATSLTVPDLKEAICVRIPCGRVFLCVHNYRGLCSPAAPARPRSRARFPMPVPAAVCPRARAARAAPLEYRRVCVRVVCDCGWLCTRHHPAARTSARLVFGARPVPVAVWPRLRAARAALLVYNFGTSEFRNFGISEFRNFGISEFRNFGISEFRNFRISEFRNLGI
jgi:hypothetical protein